MTSSMGGAFAAFCVEHGVDPEAFRRVVEQAYRGDDEGSMIARVETGRVSEEEFERWLAGVLSEGLAEPLDPSGLRERLFAGMVADERMRRAVERARRAGVRTGLLSNSWGAGGYVTEALEPLFDAIVISGRVGLRKPDPRIYRMAADMLGLEPGECVFVDDLLPNVEGARRAGMEAFVHRSAAFTVPRLEELLGVPLGDPSE